MYKFVFDVDGTLTPSRGKIDSEFHDWFLQFCKEEPVFLVTGSDHPKTLEQLGEDICYHVKRVFNCSGSDVWMQGKNIESNPWKLADFPRKWLMEQLEESNFEFRTGNHIEERPGMVNFSVVGRNADQSMRARYVEYDKTFKERARIAREFNYIFGEGTSHPMHATVGGETGIDIHPLGANKSQILKYFKPYDGLVFFGDRMEEGGNDEPLARANHMGVNIHVKDWKETWEKLKEYAGNK